MAYTNTWDETDPDGDAVQADQLDDKIQALKQDVRERMNDVLASGGKWTDDPILLSTSNRLGQVLIVHPSSAVGELASDAVDYGNGRVAISASAQPTHILVIPLPLFDFWKVTKIDFLINRGSNANVVAKFLKATYDSSNTPTTIATITHTTSGLSVGVIFSGTETIVDTNVYSLLLETSGANSMSFGGARVTYDEV